MTCSARDPKTGNPCRIRCTCERPCRLDCHSKSFFLKKPIHEAIDGQRLARPRRWWTP